MGFYNMIFGKNANGNKLLALLGFTEDSFYRFRDCYLEENEKGLCIAVYTRAGGGNSECWCDEWATEEGVAEIADKDGHMHKPGCVTLINETMSSHPLYIDRADDDFDYTYCTYYFRVPDEQAIQNMDMEPDRNSMWIAFLDGLRKTD